MLRTLVFVLARVVTVCDFIAVGAVLYGLFSRRYQAPVEKRLAVDLILFAASNGLALRCLLRLLLRFWS